MKEYFDGLDFSAPMGKHQDIQFHSTSTHDEKHGRIEDRDYGVGEDVGWLIERHPAWKSIRSIGVVESGREEKGRVSVERRYFVSSLPADPEEFARVERGHWGQTVSKVIVLCIYSVIYLFIWHYNAIYGGIISIF